MHADGLNHELGSIYGIDVVLSKADSIGTVAGHITTLLSPKARKRNAGEQTRRIGGMKKRRSR
jgi:hypothetical protein